MPQTPRAVAPRTWTRRQALQVGAVAFGLQLPQLLHAEATARVARRASPRVRSVVVLFLSGGPSQLDMFDLKPDAPEDIRGTFKPIRTRVPGIQLCEHLPRLASQTHRCTIVRSMSHEETDHVRATFWVMTGGRIARRVVQSSSMDRNDRPHFGAVITHAQHPQEGLPPFVMVPEFVSPVGVPRPGQHAGFLGTRYDPYLINSDPNEPGYSPGAIARSADGEDLQQRRALLHSLEDIGQRASEAPLLHDFEVNRARAFDLITSPQAQKAFDLTQESRRTRERYGRHTFGQSTLVARRLVEAGVRLVQVNFVRHDNGKGGQGFDSHASPPNPPHLEWLKKELLPPTDAAFASLVEDLADRGLLEETLVVMMGEFGRTPRFNKNGGRDHWSRCYSVVLAGGGIKAGTVYGASDQQAAYPTTTPVAPEDLIATIYQLTGVDPHGWLRDLQNRPMVISEGKPVVGLLA